MRKSLSLFLVAGMVAATTLLAGLPANSQDFAVSVVGMQQSWQYKGLPMVYYGGNHRSRSPEMGELSDYSFFVVVQNVQKVPDKITMGASAWHGCLHFTLKTGSGKIYAISRMPSFNWSANPMMPWIFTSGGIRILPVDFTSGSWQGFPALQPPDQIVTLTVKFSYPDSNRKMASVASSPTDVYLYHE
jgi:hypothetical protein